MIAQEKLEVIPIILLLLGRHETVMGIHQQLIVPAFPQYIKETISFLEKIDCQLKNLRITVKKGLKSQLNLRCEVVMGEVPIPDTGRVIVNRGTMMVWF